MSTGIYLIDHPPAVRQYRSPRRERPSGVVVVHTAESLADQTGPDFGAEATAAFIARRTNFGSYHDLVDSDTRIQLVRYSDEAFHDATGSNPHSYGVSAAAQAAKWLTYDSAWRTATVDNMARSAARYSRWLMDQRGIIIPARRITRAESEARIPGFISHAERDPDRRTDPGKTFPWAFFISRYAFHRFQNSVPPTTGTIQLEDEMQVFRLGDTRYRVLSGDRYSGLPRQQAEIWQNAGVKILGITAETDALFTQVFQSENLDA